MDRIAGMTGPEHFVAGEHALETAETTNLDGGDPAQVARHARHIGEARAHFAAAQVLAWAALVADNSVSGVSEKWAALLGLKADGE